MPPLETHGRFQKATLWPVSGVSREGEVTFGSPREVNVRWVWKESQGVDANGTAIGLSATVILDEEVPIESLMWEGKLADWADASTQDNNGLMQVKTTGKTPDVKGRFTRYEVGLARYRDRVPS